MEYDLVNNPKHYVERSAKLEPIDILKYAPFALGSALKYMIRAGYKDDELQDLNKAEYYLNVSSKTIRESCDGNATYQEFFDKYGMFLPKFPGLPKIQYTMSYSPDIISKLLEFVQYRKNMLDRDSM